MFWRFTIIDRNGLQTVIEEPVGWDAAQIIIERHKDYHGVFFDYQGNDFQFYGKGFRVIKSEYDEYGIEGNLLLRIEQACENATFKKLYEGRLLFVDASFDEGEGCSVTIPVETSSDIMELWNRWDQEVNLLSLTAFDQITALEPYGKLGYSLSLPPKSIVLSDSAEFETANPVTFLLPPIGEYAAGNPVQPNRAVFNITPQFDKLNFAEFGQFAPQGAPFNSYLCYGFIAAYPVEDTKCVGYPLVPGTDVVDKRYVYLDTDGIPPLMYNNPDEQSFAFVNEFSLNVSFSLEFNLIDSGIAALYTVVAIHRANGTTTFLDQQEYINTTYGNIWQKGTTQTIAYDKSFTGISLGYKDYLFVSLAGVAEYLNQDADLGKEAFTVTAKSGLVTASANSQFAATDSKVFLINETISRVAESVTENKLKVYSELFGRTDSQPYATTVDGCAGNVALTKGLFIRRQENRIEGEVSPMAISMQNIFDGIEPIFHIGMGIEPDPERIGFNRMRVEEWRYFYSDEILMECLAIDKVKRRVIADEHYSTFEFGYGKWEAEEYNGLDEFLTRRRYRTTLTQIQNELQKISTFIASGYAIEVTRRKGDIDTADWRYDNETFVICCKNENTLIKVEQGNILNAENIIDPDTIYNYRISPVRNAMRWAETIFKSYKHFTNDSKMIFMDGDGNIFAKGLLNGDCREENQTLAENQEINPTLFTAPPKPFLSPERIEFEYPLSIAEMILIQENPTGLIHFEGIEETGDGWIDKITYTPEEGKAFFSLIPKYE